jgi:hypothetical protein
MKNPETVLGRLIKKSHPLSLAVLQKNKKLKGMRTCIVLLTLSGNKYENHRQKRKNLH